MPQEKLFQEFPPISAGEWEEIIRAELKGADYEKKLIWKTREGFNIKPYYRLEDLDSLSFYRSLPGEFPFVRGNFPEYKGWKIQQNIWVDNPAEANAKALSLLSNGVNSLCFCFSKDAIARFLNRNSFSLLLEPSSYLQLDFILPSDRTRDALSLLKEYALENRIDHRKIQGTFDYNILGNLTLTGKYSESEAGDWSRLIMALQKAVKHFPEVKVIGIDGSIFRNAGSLIVQELAFSFSMACEYLSV
jgi:methylmalonyl-CoA mutase